MEVEKDHSYSGKADDFRLCDVCGRNVPIKDIKGKCQHRACGNWVCGDCFFKCRECFKTFCRPEHDAGKCQHIDKQKKTGGVCDKQICPGCSIKCSRCDKIYCKTHAAGECQYVDRNGNKCNKSLCINCGLKCEECLRIFCAEHARVLSEKELKSGDRRGKIACIVCVPPSKCFIATAAYGTPFAEEINVLRFWRDEHLSTNLFGRTFVDFYYHVSPPIANFIADKPNIRKLVRLCLSPYIKFLQKRFD
jgi:hypothetical protein